MAADLIAPIMSKYQNYNINADPSPEIISLEYASFENKSESIPANGRLVLVLIEPRILAPIPGLNPSDDLISRLIRYKGDIRAEGYHSRFIIANVYRGNRNQDGRTVIAIRRFLRDVKTAHPNLEGVVLVGSFPETAFVRRMIWAPTFEQDVMGQRRTGRYLDIYPGTIDTRTDIILSDLTGNWESLYHEAGLHIQGIIAYPDTNTATQQWSDGIFVNTGNFSSNIFRIDDIAYNDVFYLDDANFTILEQRNAPNPLLRISVNSNLLNPELSADDRTRVNKIARPEISVSRINAFNIAFDPDPNLSGTDGKKFLDVNGNPQIVTSANNIIPQNQVNFFTFRNPILERKLYVSYFDRNHKFRVGAFGNLPFRVGTINGAPELSADTFANDLNKASNSFLPALVVRNANLANYVNFYKQPSVLKGITAHSTGQYSEFHNTATPEQIQSEVGGNPIRWIKFGNQYQPSYANLNGVADLFIHRAMWHNNTLRTAGASIMVHDGCEANAAYGNFNLPYQDPNYAKWQNMEGILFFTNTVALVSRAKVFNDRPWGFPEGFSNNDRANVGMAFKNYYEMLSNNSAVTRDYAHHKRAYNWSLNGDWTVRLRNKNGLGILQLQNNSIIANHVHPDKAWIEGWNFDSGMNTIKCIGDIDGDGIDEFIIWSEWGLGILKHDGKCWRQLLVAPRDTWFGGWRYDATINTGRDKIIGAANLTGTGASELLITSNWGLGCLTWNGATLTTSFILQNGNRIGGWLLNTANDKFEGFGNFDATSQKEVLVTSSWGLGILSLQSKTSLVMVANGAMLQGGWRINTKDNTIAAIADFDGDGKEEILITSPWGIGILKVQGNTLITVAIHANDTVLEGGYIVKNKDKIWTVTNLLGGAFKQIVFANATGIHILSLNGNKLKKIAGLNNGQRTGGWLLNTNDNKCLAAADFDGNGRSEMFIHSPWGIGIIGLSGANTFVNPALHPFKTVLGDWYLESTDKFTGSGNLIGGSNIHEILVKK